MTEICLAVDIGGTAIKLGLVTRAGDALVETSAPTPRGGAPDALVAAIATAYASLADRVGAAAVTMGVSVAGFIDPDRSRMTYNANLPELADFPLRQTLMTALGLSCRLEVDSNAATLAEYRFGTGQASQRFLCLTFGTGVGGGVIIDGELLRYCGECAGDLGHIITDVAGPRCSCGSIGCLEAVASAPQLEKVTGRSAREAIEASRQGDPACRAALSEMGYRIGIALCSYVSLFNVDTIAIGGGLSVAGDDLLGPIRTCFEERAPDNFRRKTVILEAALGPRAGLIGAACVGFEAR